MVGRELDRTPKLLVAVHPSRGLDIGATKYIQSKIMEQRDRGTAVLMVSTELDELIELSDRIMVMFEGRSWESWIQKDASRETLGPMMAGLTERKINRRIHDADHQDGFAVWWPLFRCASGGYPRPLI